MRTPVYVSVALAFGVLFAGGLLTTIGAWYNALRKPSWQPPGWLFAPAWSVIAACTAAAGVLAWDSARSERDRVGTALLFALNGALNILWSGLFFRLRRPDWALGEVVPLWASIAALMLGLPRRPGTSVASSGVTWLLAPYLGWVTVAAALNLEVVRLNGPFGADRAGG